MTFMIGRHAVCLKLVMVKVISIFLKYIKWDIRTYIHSILGICWKIKKAREFRRKCIPASLTALKSLCGTQQWKILKKCDYQTTWPVFWETCKQVKKQQLEPEMEPMDWFKIKKGVHQGCILSHCLFNLHADYIMWKARLDESQSGIKIVGRNINSLI